MPVASWWMATRPGTPLPSLNWRRTRWPGLFGAIMPTSTSDDGSIWPKWIEKPCANSSRLPGAMPSATSASQISACFSSGNSTITMSPRLAASAIEMTSRPSARAFSTELESSRRPTTTVAPESFRLSACAWPWEPYPRIATVLPSSFARSASLS